MANTDIKGVIFDYGGTIDSRGDHWSEVIWDGYREAGVQVTKEQFRDCYVYAERELAKTTTQRSSTTDTPTASSIAQTASRWTKARFSALPTEE